MDEIVEFPKNVLQVLRQPIEDRRVCVSRASGTFTFPADFQLIAACNPCPCGFYGDPEKECTCSESQINRYLNKIGGPLMDRIDIQMNVARVAFHELHTEAAEESSAEIRKRVIAARQRQEERYDGLDIHSNAELSRHYMEDFCRLDRECTAVLEKIFKRLHLSARGHDRLIKLARTVADLYGEKEICS